MKKKVRFLIACCLFVFVFFGGYIKVSAENFDIYGVGDKVTVQLRDGFQKDFYVISYSDSTTSTIKAIMDTAPTDTYTYDEITQELSNFKTAWVNAKEVRLPDINELISNSNIATADGGTFESPDFVKSTTSYWTSNAASNSGHWIIGGSNSKAYSKSLDTDKNAIRPVITIDKDKIVSSKMNEESSKALFNSFVENYKQTSDISFLIDEGNKITYDATDNTLAVKLVTPSNTTTTVNFTYSDGIITYVANDNLSNSDYFYVMDLQENCIYAWAKVVNYDYGDVSDWFYSKYYSQGNQIYFGTLKDDGLLFKLKKYTYATTKDNIVVTSFYGEQFQFDIRNGLKKYVPGSGSNSGFGGSTGGGATGDSDEAASKSTDNTKNPNTGLSNTAIIGGLIITLGGISFVVIRKLTKA